MSDDPQQTPETTPRTGRELLAELITIMAVDKRERDQERADAALFREWLTGQIKAIHADIRGIVEDRRLHNERLTRVEERLGQLACAPGNGNGSGCGEGMPVT